MHPRQYIAGESTSRERILQLSNMDYAATYQQRIGHSRQQNVYSCACYLQGQLHKNMERAGTETY